MTTRQTTLCLTKYYYMAIFKPICTSMYKSTISHRKYVIDTFRILLLFVSNENPDTLSYIFLLILILIEIIIASVCAVRGLHVEGIKTSYAILENIY